MPSAFRRLASWVGLATVALAAERGAGQIVAPSIFTTSIHVQGEAAGTEYDDWGPASGIPVVYDDPADNPFDLDIAGVQIANDNDFIYIRATTHNTETTSLVNLFLSFDTDADKTTGFDTLQVGMIGSELGYQNDFPFAQYKDIFNLNISLTGGPVNNGGALIYPFWETAAGPQGTQMEWAVPRDVLIQYPTALGGPSPSFPNPTFDFVIFTDQGLADITDVIRYTLATAPTSNPDFDASGAVDGNDVVLWQRGFGATTGATLGQGDANGDGDVDADDLAAWTGAFPGSAAAVTAAPEPTAAALAALALAACWRKSRPAG